MPASGPSAIDADPLDLGWVLSVNVVGTWNGCSVFGKRLAARPESGWIVNTASEHALDMQHAGQAFYTASKHAILGMSNVIRAELPDQVGISVLCPGLVKPELWNAARHRARPLDGDAEAFLPFAKAVMGHGLPPIEVAHKAIDGVERGDCLIVTTRRRARRPSAAAARSARRSTHRRPTKKAGSDMASHRRPDPPRRPPTADASPAEGTVAQANSGRGRTA